MGKLSDKLNEFWDIFGSFVYTYWGLYWIVLLLVMVGGVLSAFFGWPFALFVPAWLLFAGYIMKIRYKKKYIKE